MAKASGMSAPVTRGELKEELKLLRGELQRAIEPLATKEELQRAIEPLATKEELKPLATKVELELWGGALMARMDRMHQQLLIDLARHVTASHEQTMAMIRALDDRYVDLPERVRRLEFAVFVPESQ